MKQTLQNFQVLSAPLHGKNLIEASAGTGKTYSIAVLVLRLILEKKVSITDFLMVTFTNAAVAELDRRIKAFILDAHKYYSRNIACDTTVMQIVDTARTLHEQEELETIFKDAPLLLDELQIQTIHSFCQQTLQEFAFETKQPFDIALVSDFKEIVERFFNDFWRQHITTLPVEILALFDLANFRNNCLAIVQSHINGVHYASLPTEEEIAALWDTLKTEKELLRYLNEKIEDAKNAINAYLLEHRNEVSEQIKQSKLTPYTKVVKALNADETLAQFWGFIDSYTDTKKISQLLNDALPEELHPSIETFLFTNSNSLLFNCLLGKAIYFVVAKLKHYKAQSNVLSYNDIIKELHQSVTATNNHQIIAALQNKYKAVFVDEFQDTDKEQFEIFSTAFAENTIVFLIGDPKQSIYAFRKADIATYFKARNFVDNYYTMNTNFRSNKEFIASMNVLFQPLEGFDTFHYHHEQEQINYIQVQSPEPNTKGAFTYKNIQPPHINIQEVPSAEEALYHLAVDVGNILKNEHYTIYKNEEHHNIQPHDIGILVRNTNDGLAIQSILSNMGIPSVLKNDKKIFEQSIAAWTAYLLQAIISNHISDIKTAISHALLGYTLEELQQLNEIKLFHLFERLKETWQNSGITACLLQASNLLGLQEKWTADSVKKKDLANYHQLIEILHKKAYHQQLNAEDLLLWLKRGINQQLPEEDAFLQRLESDEAAVQIVTIHASKGLEYPLVFVPTLHLNDNYSPRRTQQLYRDDDGSYYMKISSELTEREKNLINTQLQQENRRLLYVAITRAIYHCTVYHFHSTRTANTFRPFILALQENPTEFISFNNPTVAPNEDKKWIIDTPTQAIKLFPEAFIPENNWSLLSFSKMVIHLESYKIPRTDTFSNDYDKFVYYQLRSGAEIGSFLHYILEKLEFDYQDTWMERINYAIKKHFPNPQDFLAPMLLEMLQHITQAKLVTEEHTVLRLQQINKSQKLAELEFHFPLTSINLPALRVILEDAFGTSIKHNYSLEGLMHGFIDLIFKFENKYYILDWKSNYLGFHKEDYNKENIATAMYQNGYHAQYFLYTVALHLYLQSRIVDYNYDRHFGGVFYLFVRGLRAEETTGIYHYRLSLEQLNSITNQA